MNQIEEVEIGNMLYEIGRKQIMLDSETSKNKCHRKDVNYEY